MRKVLAVAWKDALVRFSSRSELLFFLVLPVVFTFLIGGGLGANAPADDTRLSVLLVDEDGSDLAGELAAELVASETVQVTAATRAEAEARLAEEAVTAWVLIPAGFAEGLRAGEAVALEAHTQPNDPNVLAAELAVKAAAGRVSSALTAARASVEEAERRRAFADEAERSAYFESSLSAAQDLLAEAPTRLAVTGPANAPAPQGSGLSAAAQASVGQLITWVFIPLLGTSALFAYERQQGTLRRLLTTPSRKATFLLGTLGGQLALALVQMLLLVGFGMYVMGLDWGHSPAGLLVMLLSFGLAAVALGTMLGTFIKTESQGSGLSIMLGMVMALLGGCWYPSEFFPEVAQVASRALPTAWAMQGLTDLVMRGQGLAAVLPEAGVLVGFAVVFFSVGVWRFRYE